MNTPALYQPIKELNTFTMHDAVNVIIEDISPKLIHYFDEKITPALDMNLLLQSHLQTWVKENRNTTLMDSYPETNSITEPTLFNAIFCELSTVLSQCSETEAYIKQKEVSRGRKKYLYSQLREEMGELHIKPKNSLFMQKEWESLNNPYVRKNLGIFPENIADAILNKSFDEFKIQSFEIATKWYKNKESFLIDFPYYDMLNTPRKLKMFLIDLVNNCLAIICKDYYRSRSGFITGTFDTRLGLNDTSVFSWQSNALDLKYEITDGVLQVYESLELSPIDSLKIIVHEEPYDDSINGANPEQLFSKIKHDINNGQQYRTLDTFDLAILTAILNNFSVASLQDKSLHINLPDLAHDVYGNVKMTSEKYERLVKHIIKLGRTRISNVSTTDNGMLIGGENITFFEYKFKVLTNASLENERILTTINIASGNTKIDYSKLFVKDYAAMELDFYLSNYMYKLWNNSVHTYISTTLYKQIESSKGKVLMQLLQEQRLHIYPECATFIPFAIFRSHLKVASRLDRFKNEIAEELENMKQNKIAIQDYEILSNGVNVSFYPLSVAEKTVYKL